MANRKDETGGSFPPNERTAQEGGNSNQQAMQQIGDSSAQMADRGLRQAAEMARQQSEEARHVLSASSQAYHQSTEHSRADVDALMQSSTRLARGLQEMGWELTHFTQESMRLGMRLASGLLECRTVEDMVSLQRDIVKESVETLLSESARLLTMSSQVANEAVTPIAERVGDTAIAPKQQAIPERERPSPQDAPNRSRESGSGREARH